MPKQPRRAQRRSEPRGRLNTDLVELGRAIRAARDRGEFATFCATVPVHSRKAYDLIAIVDAIDARRLTPQDVATLGWSKARLIAERASTRAVARQAVAFARDNTLPAVVAYFRDDRARKALVTKSFHLTLQQARTLEAALVRASGVRRGGRLQNRTEALMAILREFSAWHAAKGRQIVRSEQVPDPSTIGS